MNSGSKLSAIAVVAIVLLGGCAGGIGDLSNTEQVDATDPAGYPAAVSTTDGLLTAFYGLDDAVPFLASYRICRGFGHQDGMPVIFSKEVDVETLQAGDFLVTLADGATVAVACVTPAPAEDVGELRTILMIGDFGSINNQPVTVEVIGNLVSKDQQTNFKGSTAKVTALEDGPFLVLAESISPDQWQLEKQATRLPFGGGDGCPGDTRQIIRAVWAGGVTKPGGDEVDDVERAAYDLQVAGEDGEMTTIQPFALADLGDGDNNHELCLDVDATVVSVSFPADLMTDPREDLNPATSVVVSY